MTLSDDRLKKEKASESHQQLKRNVRRAASERRYKVHLAESATKHSASQRTAAVQPVERGGVEVAKQICSVRDDEIHVAGRHKYGTELGVFDANDLGDHFRATLQGRYSADDRRNVSVVDVPIGIGDAHLVDRQFASILLVLEHTSIQQVRYVSRQPTKSGLHFEVKKLGNFDTKFRRSRG